VEKGQFLLSESLLLSLIPPFFPSTTSKYTHSVSRSESGACAAGQKVLPRWRIYLSKGLRGAHWRWGSVLPVWLHLDERQLKKPFRLSREISPLAAITHAEDSSEYNTHEPASAEEKFLFGTDVCALGLRASQKKHTYTLSFRQYVHSSFLHVVNWSAVIYVRQKISNSWPVPLATEGDGCHARWFKLLLLLLTLLCTTSTFAHKKHTPIEKCIDGRECSFLAGKKLMNRLLVHWLYMLFRLWTTFIRLVKRICAQIFSKNGTCLLPLIF
jgi:hypothetical protein